MEKSQAVTLKRSVRMTNSRRRVRCRKSKAYQISPPVKIILLAEETEEEVENDEGDFCQNWGPSISFHNPKFCLVQGKYEEKIAELEEQLKNAKAETGFWFWRAEQLEFDLQNQRVQHEIALNGREALGESDEATSQCSCLTGPSEADKWQGSSSDSQSGAEKWRCRICGEKEAGVVVLPCRHLCLCLDCGKKAKRCPVCNKHRNDFLLVPLA